MSVASPFFPLGPGKDYSLVHSRKCTPPLHETLTITGPHENVSLFTPCRAVYELHYSAPLRCFSTPHPLSWPQLPSSLHTLPRHLINVTHRLPSKTEGIVFVSSAADKAFWKADMHNDSAVIASLVWNPFLSVPHAACCCLTEQPSAPVSPQNMFGSQIHLGQYDRLSWDFIHYCDEWIRRDAERVCERKFLCERLGFGHQGKLLGIVTSQVLNAPVCSQIYPGEEREMACVFVPTNC